MEIAFIVFMSFVASLIPLPMVIGSEVDLLLKRLYVICSIGLYVAALWLMNLPDKDDEGKDRTLYQAVMDVLSQPEIQDNQDHDVIETASVQEAISNAIETKLLPESTKPQSLRRSERLKKKRLVPL
jgi:hypothetical protein